MMFAPPLVLLAIAVVLGIVQLARSKVKKQRIPEGARPLPGPKGTHTPLLTPERPLTIDDPL